VHSRDVIEPHIDIALIHQVIVQTLLSQVFKNNLTTLNCIVGWLNCAVLTATIAVRLNVALVAANTLPENVMRFKSDSTLKTLLERLEVLNKVDGTVRA